MKTKRFGLVRYVLDDENYIDGRNVQNIKNTNNAIQRTLSMAYMHQLYGQHGTSDILVARNYPIEEVLKNPGGFDIIRVGQFSSSSASQIKLVRVRPSGDRGIDYCYARIYAQTYYMNKKVIFNNRYGQNEQILLYVANECLYSIPTYKTCARTTVLRSFCIGVGRLPSSVPCVRSLRQHTYNYHTNIYGPLHFVRFVMVVHITITQNHNIVLVFHFLAHIFRNYLNCY